MRTSIGLLAATLVAGLLGASCMTKGQRSDIVLSAVLLPTSSGATCSCPTPSSSGGGEPDFLPAGNVGLAPCLQIENRLPNNSNLPIRLNTNDFQIEELHLTYENVGGPPAALPAGEIVYASNGLIPAGSKATLGAVLVPANIGASLPSKSAIRVHAYFQGRLLDSKKIKSSEYEYIVVGCGGVCNPQPACVNAPY